MVIYTHENENKWSFTHTRMETIDDLIHQTQYYC